MVLMCGFKSAARSAVAAQDVTPAVSSNGGLPGRSAAAARSVPRSGRPLARAPTPQAFGPFSAFRPPAAISHSCMAAGGRRSHAAQITRRLDCGRVKPSIGKGSEVASRMCYADRAEVDRCEMVARAAWVDAVMAWAGVAWAAMRVGGAAGQGPEALRDRVRACGALESAAQQWQMTTALVNRMPRVPCRCDHAQTCRS